MNTDSTFTAPRSSSKGEVRIDWRVSIPLRDGTCLSATAYHPRQGSVRRPCIVTMTPYMRDNHHGRGLFFARAGFVFLAVDVRGRGGSGGNFNPLLQEARDGHDVVEWAAHKRFCNGKVAMWGGSYSGYAQWATAKEFPKHLACIAPAAAAYPGLDVPMRNNIFQPYGIQWLTYTEGTAAQKLAFGDLAFWQDLFKRWHESGSAFRELDGWVGNPSPVFQQWLDHPRQDKFWASHSPRPKEYRRLSIPILTITGIYDDDQIGALGYYRQHMQYGSKRCRSRHHLVIGPWDHAGTRDPALQFGGIEVGPASKIDLLALHDEWYRWRMCGGTKPAFLKNAVVYYVMVAERWRSVASLDAVTSGRLPLYLSSAVNPNDPFCSGSLGERQSRRAVDSYTYDPRKTRGPEVTAEAALLKDALIDQTLVHAMRGKSLFYHSDAFEDDLEIGGFFRLVLWLSIDQADADIYVSIYELDTDGGSVLLSTDAIRARYREGLHRERLVLSRRPLRYEFNRFTFVSRLIKKERRLRLLVGPVGRLVDAGFRERNFGAGGAVAGECVDQGRPVTVRVLHDRRYRSVLYMPLANAPKSPRTMAE